MRVDGEGGHLAEVLTTGYLFGSNIGRQLLSRLLYLLRIGVGQSVLCQDGVHLGIVLALLTQYVHYLANRTL